jgi:hypothetical protein
LKRKSLEKHRCHYSHWAQTGRPIRVWGCQANLETGEGARTGGCRWQWPSLWQTATLDGGARGQGGVRRRGEPILGLRAGRCSPEDPVRSSAVEAGVLASVRLERRWRKGVDRSERWFVCTRSSGRRQLGRGMTGVTRRCGWPRRRLESTTAGDFRAASGPVARE